MSTKEKKENGSFFFLPFLFFSPSRGTTRCIYCEQVCFRTSGCSLVIIQTVDTQTPTADRRSKDTTTRKQGSVGTVDVINWEVNAISKTLLTFWEVTFPP